MADRVITTTIRLGLHSESPITHYVYNFGEGGLPRIGDRLCLCDTYAGTVAKITRYIPQWTAIIDLENIEYLTPQQENK